MSQLWELQDRIVTQIRALPAVIGPPPVTVLPERLGELANRLARSQCALSLLVAVTPVQIYRSSADPSLRRVTAKASIVTLENVVTHRVGAGYRTAADIAEAIGQGLHGWVIPGTYGTARTMVAECLSLEYGYATEALWAIPLSQLRWTAKEAQSPLVYRVRLETDFDW
jgi:hypothetical protein